MGARKKTAFIKHLIDEGLIIKELKAIYPADIDIFDINSTSPLNKVENEKITEYINSIGKYDAQTQIDKSTEFCDSFRLIKKDYQQFYSTHYKLIYAAGFSFGALISILLI